ncbi:MAG: YncE family protein [Acidobacteriota bacterium]|nr:YncE family protein [Acidobacteriota bacterium]
MYTNAWARLLCGYLVAFSAIISSLSAQALKKVGGIDLPGPKGQRFDYLTMDDEDHYLLSAHLGPGILYVINVKTNQLVKAIPGVPGITGLEYVPGLHKVYTSNWGEEKIGVVDLGAMTVVKRLPTGAKPNGSAYAEPFRKVYVVNTLGKAVSVIDVDKDTVVQTLRFNSETGMPGYDSVARRIYVNLRSTNEIAEIDPQTDTIAGRFPVAGCRFNHGMAVDSEHHRAFLLCGGTHSLTVFALDTHKAIAHLPLAAGADVVKYDPGLGRIYAACSSGFISVFQAEGNDRYHKIEDFPVQKLVHSLAVDTATHLLYAPEQQEDGRPAARIVIYKPSEKAKKP